MADGAGRQPVALDAQFGVLLHAGRHLDVEFLAAQGGHLDARAEAGLAERKAVLHHQVVVHPLKHRVISHMHLQVEVAGRPAGRRWPALAGQAQPLAVLDALGHLDRDVLAAAVLAQADGFLGAMEHILQGHGQFVGEIAALDRLRPAAAATAAPHTLAEHALKGRATARRAKAAGVHAASAAKIAAETELAEDVVEIEVAEDVFLGVALAEPGGAEGIVLLAFFRIREHRVGLADLLELLFSGLVPGVFVRVVLEGQFTVRLLDLVGGGRFRHAENLVILHSALLARVNGESA